MKSKHQTSNPSKHYLRKRDLLAQYLPFSATTLWRKVKTGEFPEPIKLSPGVSAWRTSDIEDWFQQKGSKC